MSYNLKRREYKSNRISPILQVGIARLRSIGQRVLWIRVPLYPAFILNQYNTRIGYISPSLAYFLSQRVLLFIFFNYTRCSLMHVPVDQSEQKSKQVAASSVGCCRTGCWPPFRSIIHVARRIPGPAPARWCRKVTGPQSPA